MFTPEEIETAHNYLGDLEEWQGGWDGNITNAIKYIGALHEDNRSRKTQTV